MRVIAIYIYVYVCVYRYIHVYTSVYIYIYIYTNIDMVIFPAAASTGVSIPKKQNHNTLAGRRGVQRHLALCSLSL